MSSKTDFSNFAVGTVFNEVVVTRPLDNGYRIVEIDYPSRLEAMALDPAKIADNNNLVYEAGQIDISIKIFKHITVKKLTTTDDIIIDYATSRPSLVRHAALLMQKALGFKEGLHISVEDEVDLRHCGLGSSSGLIAGTAAAINELYGLPMEAQDLIRYCTQNHGEEINGDISRLVPVQCIGGSAVCGHTRGSLVILAGQATPIFQYTLDESLSVVIGVPKDFEHPDSQELMSSEVENIEGFVKAGAEYGKTIAYRLVHEVMPGLVNDNLRPVKDLIFEYRWDMGSIKNCSFVYPRMIDIAESIRSYKDDADIELAALSSVGPGFFAITAKPEKVVKDFDALGLKTYQTSPHNDRYLVTNLS